MMFSMKMSDASVINQAGNQVALLKSIFGRCCDFDHNHNVAQQPLDFGIDLVSKPVFFFQSKQSCP